ncbi:hypothetical protein Dac01nite_00910 [Demequina activiva]|uniref:Uncharacterized protein n=1 Tax=Demequina activiva TaxID=1582364 RepID=A0A919Q0A7_9MICO|nr:hypothetical protein Dac01nite_00910 [Demequina activiva]
MIDAAHEIELSEPRKPWPTVWQVEFATLKRVKYSDTDRLYEAGGHRPGSLRGFLLRW